MDKNINELLPANLSSASFHNRVFWVIRAVQRIRPEQFSDLEGFTREDGGVVFISRDPRKIHNSGSGLQALPLGDSGWFVNPALSQKEARVFFERLSRAVNLPIDIKQRIISLMVPPSDKSRP